MATRSRLVAVPLACAAALVVLPVASSPAADSGYIARSFTEAADPGLTVQPPLDEFRAVARARVVVPADWRRVATAAGRLSFLTPGGPCRYRVTFTVHSEAGASGTPSDRVAVALVPAGPRYLLDEGTRAAGAFRTVRLPSAGAVVRLRAQRSAVLTRRTDIAPAGSVIWTDLRGAATSRTGDECHSGTWRERVGPQVSDALATARTSLHFVRP
jgi:hypothetical protein